MILIYAPHPDFLPEDGWGRRIKAVDRTFKDRKKIYVWPSFTTSNVPNIEKRLGSSYFQCDFRRFNHRLKLSHLIKEADFVYAHTCHSTPLFSSFYQSGKIITDLHGVAPEEDWYAGNKSASRFYDFFEENMVRNCKIKIAVTQSMIDHFVEKYHDNPDEYILFPISNEMTPAPTNNKKKGSVIYAGGAQIWQKVDLMLEAIKKTSSSFSFTILSHQKDIFEKKLTKLRVSGDIFLNSVPPEKVFEYYQTSQYGFLLRDDVLLNRVACPTKLIEYLSYGIIPIMLNPNLGDFGRLGGKYISLKDFLEGKLPSEEELETMRKSNLLVLEKINSQITEAQQKIRDFKSLPSLVPADYYDFMPIRESGICEIFPITLRIRFLDKQKKEITSLEKRDICQFDYKTSFNKPEGTKAIAVSLSSLPCSIQKLSIELGDTPIEAENFRREKNYDNSAIYFGGEYIFISPSEKSEQAILKLRLLDVAHSISGTSPSSFGKLISADSLFQLAKNTAKRYIPRDTALYSFLRDLSKKQWKNRNDNFSEAQTNEIQNLQTKINGLNGFDVIIQCDNFLSGGLENVVIDLIKAFTKKNTVLFLVLGSRGDSYKKAAALATEAISFPYDPMSYESVLKKAKPKLVLMNYSFSGIETCFSLGIKNVQVIHNLYTWFLHDNKFKKVGPFINEYVAVSDEVKNFSSVMLGLPEKKIKVIENGIHLGENKATAETKFRARTLLLNSFNFPEDSFIFFSPGSYTNQKNTLGLLKAFRKALEKNHKLRLICAGPKYDTNFFESCENYIKRHGLVEKVVLLDKQVDINRFYQGADAGVIASYYEGGPLTFLEMLSSHLPTLSTDVGMTSNYRNVPGVVLYRAPFNYDGVDIYYEDSESWVMGFSKQMLNVAESNLEVTLTDEQIQTFGASSRFEKYLNLIDKTTDKEE